MGFDLRVVKALLHGHCLKTRFPVGSVHWTITSRRGSWKPHFLGSHNSGFDLSASFVGDYFPPGARKSPNLPPREVVALQIAPPPAGPPGAKFSVSPVTRSRLLTGRTDPIGLNGRVQVDFRFALFTVFLTWFSCPGLLKFPLK